MTDLTPPDDVVELSIAGWDERVRVLRAGHEVDTFAVVTARYLVLVDTMSTPQLAAGILARVGDALAGRQLLVVNTHADYDHCWGNAVFAAPGGRHPAPIIAHERAGARLRGQEARESLARRQAQESRFADVRLVEPTITFTERLRIDGGDLTLELIPTPGHTEDHVVIWVPELRLLLAGDAAEHPFPYVSNPATLGTLRQTLHQLVALRPAMVLPCHGGTTDPALLTRNIAYFDELERVVTEALAAGRVPADGSEREDLPELVGLPYAEALRLAGADPATTPTEFYQRVHLLAVRATLANLRPPAREAGTGASSG